MSAVLVTIVVGPLMSTRSPQASEDLIGPECHWVLACSITLSCCGLCHC